MKIAIVDDDANDRELLIQLIKASLEHEAYALDITQFDSGESLLEALNLSSSISVFWIFI